MRHIFEGLNIKRYNFDYDAMLLQFHLIKPCSFAQAKHLTFLPEHVTIGQNYYILFCYVVHSGSQVAHQIRQANSIG